jgi:hypothetical protein
VAAQGKVAGRESRRKGKPTEGKATGSECVAAKERRAVGRLKIKAKGFMAGQKSPLAAGAGRRRGGRKAF